MAASETGVPAERERATLRCRRLWLTTETPLPALSGMADFAGQVGYLTIDEKMVEPGETHRRRGLHVDGVYANGAGGWSGGSGGGGWGGGDAPGMKATGMLTVSSVSGCRAWCQDFKGWPGAEGECDHLSDQCQDESCAVLSPSVAYWLDALCVHESLPMKARTPRQFVRLSLPSTAPWFDGYTENPLGVKPTGPILPRREFMMA